MNKVLHIFRILITGSGFLVFGFFCMVGNIIFVPIIILGISENPKSIKFSRFLVRNIWSLFLKYISLVQYAKYDFQGFEKLKPHSNLIIANHPSLLDVVFLLSKIKNANCIVKADLKKNIFLYPAIKCSAYILNTNNEDFLERGINSLKKGENLIIFPEGTRTKEKIVFHKAATYMALKGADFISLVLISMNPKSLKKGQKWYNTPNSVIKYKIDVLKIINVKDILQNRALPAMARELNQKLINLYEKELEK